LRVEHCIGILKTRFQSLKGIQTVIKGKMDVACISVWIRCCCILHDILLLKKDPAYVKYTITAYENEDGEVNNEESQRE
jgi:hypothetical protein